MNVNIQIERFNNIVQHYKKFKNTLHIINNISKKVHITNSSEWNKKTYFDIEWHCKIDCGRRSILKGRYHEDNRKNPDYGWIQIHYTLPSGDFVNLGCSHEDIILEM